MPKAPLRSNIANLTYNVKTLEFYLQQSNNSNAADISAVLNSTLTGQRHEQWLMEKVATDIVQYFQSEKNNQH